MEGAEGKKGEHVAAGKGTDKGLFWVRKFGVSQVFSSGGAGGGVAITIVDLVVAWVFFVGERGVVTSPSEKGGVLRHEGIVAGDGDCGNGCFGSPSYLGDARGGWE